MVKEQNQEQELAMIKSADDQTSQQSDNEGPSEFKPASSQTVKAETGKANRVAYFRLVIGLLTLAAVLAVVYIGWGLADNVKTLVKSNQQILTAQGPLNFETQVTVASTEDFEISLGERTFAIPLTIQPEITSGTIKAVYAAYYHKSEDLAVTKLTSADNALTLAIDFQNNPDNYAKHACNLYIVYLDKENVLSFDYFAIIPNFYGKDEADSDSIAEVMHLTNEELVSSKIYDETVKDYPEKSFASFEEVRNEIGAIAGAIKSRLLK